LQLAVDRAINNNASFDKTLLNEYPFTDETQEQADEEVRKLYMNGLQEFIAAAFFLGLVGVIYHLVGFMANEREIGLSQLMECMGASQAARLASYHLAFSLLYLPGWLLIGVVLALKVFKNSNPGTIVFVHLLFGLSLCSWALAGGSFFKKSQASGITVTIISLILAVLGQLAAASTFGNNSVMDVLCCLFPPMNYVIWTISVARFEAQGWGMVVDRPYFNHTDNPPKSWSIETQNNLWFTIVHIFVYPHVAALIESALYGNRSKARTSHSAALENAVELRNLSKTYRPNWLMRYFGRRREVAAVKKLSMNVRRGQIICLLGANGSGKTTTLECIAGLAKPTSGEIHLGSEHEIGLCPQKVRLYHHSSYS
jgi:ATP-binding cassette subfamily A (ABC1) protein 3